MIKNRILVPGGSGMLGHKLIQIFKKAGFDVFTTLRNNGEVFQKYGVIEPEKIITGIDVEDFESFVRIVDRLRPAVIVNAVGVIKQLPDAKLLDATLGINSIFPQRIARLTGKFGFRFINISTDCVFSGKKGNYKEEDVCDAGDLYGQSKFLGEADGHGCLTLRTSIIGRELETSHSLVEWFLKNKGGKVRGFTNAIYTGFPTLVLGEIIAGIVTEHPDLEGVYHVSSEPISKFDLLGLINDKFGLGIEIEPFDDFYIDRSLDSTKFRKATGFEPASWDAMIRRMAEDGTEYEKWRQQKS